MIKQLEFKILHLVGGFLVRSDDSIIESFSIYDCVSFSEYKVNPLNCVTIGFHERGNEMHVLLFSKTLEAIQQNIKAVKENRGVKLFNPIVFVIDLDKKSWLKIRSDFGNYVNGTLLKENFRRVFDIIIDCVHELHGKNRVSQGSNLEPQETYANY